MQTFMADPHRLGNYLRDNFRDLNWTEFRAAIAFVKASGTNFIASDLQAFARRAEVRISAGIDHGGTTAEGLAALLGAVGDNAVWVFKGGNGTFHPKLYMFKRGSAAEVIVGSGNLTKGGLYTNYEASVRLVLDLTKHEDATLLKEVETAFDRWSTPKHGVCIPLNEPLLELLVASGDLPSEAMVRASRARATDENASKATAQSPFTGEPAPGAPQSNVSASTVARGEVRGSAPKGESLDVICRVVVRGRTRVGGQLLRRVRDIEAFGKTFDEYMADARRRAAADGVYEDLATKAGFVEVKSRSVLPPRGMKLDQSVSKGFDRLPDGTPVWVEHGHVPGTPVPASRTKRQGRK